MLCCCTQPHQLLHWLVKGQTWGRCLGAHHCPMPQRYIANTCPSTQVLLANLHAWDDTTRYMLVPQGQQKPLRGQISAAAHQDTAPAAAHAWPCYLHTPQSIRTHRTHTICTISDGQVATHHGRMHPQPACPTLHSAQLAQAMSCDWVQCSAKTAISPQLSASSALAPSCSTRCCNTPHNISQVLPPPASECGRSASLHPSLLLCLRAAATAAASRPGAQLRQDVLRLVVQLSWQPVEQRRQGPAIRQHCCWVPELVKEGVRHGLVGGVPLLRSVLQQPRHLQAVQKSSNPCKFTGLHLSTNKVRTCTRTNHRSAVTAQRDSFACKHDRKHDCKLNRSPDQWRLVACAC